MSVSFLEYVSRYIPPENQWRLDDVLDGDDESETHLIEIAKPMTQWEVKLVGPLQLTPGEVGDINEIRKPELRRLASVLAPGKACMFLNRYTESHRLNVVAKIIIGNNCMI